MRSASLRGASRQIREFSSASYLAPGQAGIYEGQSGYKELTKDVNYCVTLLPANPPQLRADGQFSGTFSEETSYACSVHGANAYVWKYTSPDAVPEVTPFNIPVLTNSQKADDQVLAVFVSCAVDSKEPGIITIGTKSGVVTYWEAVGDSLADGLLRRKTSINFTLELYGDEVKHVANIGAPGIAIVTKIGRYIILSTRDSSGKPELREIAMKEGTVGSMVTNVFGYVRSTFNINHYRNQICAVKPEVGAHPQDHSSKVNLAFLNANGCISIWETAMSQNAKLLVEHDLSLLVQQSIETQYPLSKNSLQFHDVEFNGNVVRVLCSCLFDPKAASVAGNTGIEAMVNSSGYTTRYLICTITDHSSAVKWSVTSFSPTSTIVTAHALHNYQRPLTHIPPKLLFPAPYDTLFVVFPDALIMTDARDRSNGPVLWDEPISLATGVFVGAVGKEDRQMSNNILTRNSGVVLMTNSGVIRVERFASDTTVNGVQLKPHQIEATVAKSRIDQVIAYGFDEDNPLQFFVQNIKVRSNDVWQEEFLKTSQEIVDGTWIYSENSSELLITLGKRIENLKRLLQFLEFKLGLSEVKTYTKLKLMWDMQLAMAAKCIWAQKLQNKSTAAVDVLTRVVSEIIKVNSLEKSQRVNRNQSSATMLSGQPVRNFFSTKGGQMALLLQALSETAASTDDSQMLVEINALLIAGITHGALSVKYETYDVSQQDEDECDQMPWLAELARILERQYDHNKAIVARGSKALISQQLQLVSILCPLFISAIGWLLNHRQADGRELELHYNSVKVNWTRELTQIGFDSEVVSLAEAYHIYRALVEIYMSEWDEHSVESTSRIANVLNHYLTIFGYDFAVDLFQFLIEKQELGIILQSLPQFSSALTQFFSNGNYDRISWIHYINNGDFTKASSALVNASSHERSPENKMFELSMAKLSYLVAGSSDANDLANLDTGITLSSLDGQIWNFLKSKGPVDSRQTKISPAYLSFYDRVIKKFRETQQLPPLDELCITLALSGSGKEAALGLAELSLNNSLPNDRKEALAKFVLRRIILVNSWQEVLKHEDISDQQLRKELEKTEIYKLILELASIDRLNPFEKLLNNAQELASGRALNSGRLVESAEQEDEDLMKTLVEEYDFGQTLRNIDGDANRDAMVVGRV